MNELRQNFLAESVNKLDRLQKILREGFDESRRREIFRSVHTIKGGLQTFGLQSSAQLAEELENILSEGEIEPRTALLLREGLELLVKSLHPCETGGGAAEFIEKLHARTPSDSKSEFFLTRIPHDIFNNFSKSEQTAVISAMRRGDRILCAEVGFEPADFAASYRDLRKVLGEKNEIIAALPSPKYDAAQKIGFQIFLASRETTETLQKMLENYSAEIVAAGDFAAHEKPALFEMLSQIAAHGEEIARQFGKTINITILTNEINISDRLAESVFEILLHLVRNAADHAVEKSGRIEIRLFDEGHGLRLTVSDNGKGVDLERIRQRAIEKNLISADDSPDENEMLELIFAAELSTAAETTGISGRGVGLDAVKSLVESLHGKISVKSRKTFGTKFEIFLPKD